MNVCLCVLCAIGAFEQGNFVKNGKYKVFNKFDQSICIFLDQCTEQVDISYHFETVD